MIDSEVTKELPPDAGWRAIEARLRPFVASRVADHFDVDDIVQEILLRVRRGLPRLRDDQRFGPWVYRVARNAIADHLRAERRRVSMLLAARDEVEGGDNEIESEDPGFQQAVGAYTASLIDSLPAPYREALRLVEVDGSTQAAAAQRLGVSVSGMKSRVQRGRRLLRAALERDCAVVTDARSRVVECRPRAHLTDCGCVPHSPARVA